MANAETPADWVSRVSQAIVQELKDTGNIAESESMAPALPQLPAASIPAGMTTTILPLGSNDTAAFSSMTPNTKAVVATQATTTDSPKCFLSRTRKRRRYEEATTATPQLQVWKDRVHREQTKNKALEVQLGILRNKVETLQTNEHSWNQNLAALLRYRAEKGDCLVPVFDGVLGKWVKKLRTLRQKGEKDSPEKYLTDERIQVLDSIEFRWRVVDEKQVSVANWETRYAELIEFKRQHGHCNVPQNQGGDLGRWVKWQRNRYVATQKWLDYIREHGSDHGYQNKDHTAYLVAYQIDRLNMLGFVWNCKPMKLGWEGQYEDLVAYREMHGHWYVLDDDVLILGGLIILGVWSDILISEYSNVPQSYKGKQNLGRWVSKQRELYWDMKKEPSQRKHSSRRLNEDRVARLEAIGFLWRGANAHHKYMRDDDQLSPIPLPPSPANAITVEEVII